MKALGRTDRRHRRRQHLWPRGRRPRPDGRDRRSDSRDVGRRPHRDRDRRQPLHPVRGDRLHRQQRRGDAVRRPRRCQARLPCRHRQCGGPGTAFAVVARPRHQRDGRADRRQGAFAAGAVADALSQFAAASAFAQARRRSARSRRAGAQHLPDLLPRPAARHLRRLRRRQVGAVVDAGTQCRRRHHRDRPRRRTRPRGAGISAGRPRRGRAWRAPWWWWRPRTNLP